jgi:hypothetical protein
LKKRILDYRRERLALRPNPMQLMCAELQDLVLQVAAARFGADQFPRRLLLSAVEARIREIGAWTPADDKLPSDRCMKSEGLAAIDWAITRLFREGRLLRP